MYTGDIPVNKLSSMNQCWKAGSVRVAKNGKFTMPWLADGPNKSSEFKRPSFGTILKWTLTRKSPSFPVPGTFTVEKPDFSEVKNGMKCTWIGHATCLLQVGGFNILTDPVFSQRCSPVHWAGPLRYVPPACKIKDLPPIHIVLISHDHYDHLDWDSILALEKRFKPIYACGLELGAWFIDEVRVPADRVIEFDWWQTKGFFEDKCQVQFVPVQHWSKRKVLNDDCRSLWGGFSVTVDGLKFFFNGDTGYSAELYKEIGERCGPFNLAAIPIGAYQPREIMKTQHIDPNEAFLIHQKIKSKRSFGIHHGTFILTDEPVKEPSERINKLSADNPHIPAFTAINHGSSLTITK